MPMHVQWGGGGTTPTHSQQGSRERRQLTTDSSEIQQIQQI